MDKYQEIDKCRVSDSRKLVSVLNLGDQPLANALKTTRNEDEEKYPLSISFCEESSLLQLNETINKEILFNQYVWVTGTSQATRQYADRFIARLIRNSSLEKDDLVIEIASNDGTFLKPLLKRGFTNCIGVDPAKNIADAANKEGVSTLPEFWSSPIANQIVSDKGLAKVVFARNVIPHVSELTDVVLGIKIVLGESGIGIIEFHDASRILEELHYDSIYHEHLCYFSIKSITYLLNRFELNPFHIEKSTVSGGGWVIYFSPDQRPMSVELQVALSHEKQSKVNDLGSWREFSRRVKAHREKTSEIFQSFDTKKVVGFGSSARSQTYLNYCDIDHRYVDAIIDNNPLKHGRFTPGSCIPIVDLDDGISLQPNIICIFAWNFRDEIAKECRSRGFTGEFFLPFPNEPYFYNPE